MPSQTKEVVVKGENGNDEKYRLGECKLLTKVNGKPFQSEASAKGNLTWYNNRNKLQGYEVIEFLDGYALYNPKGE